MAFQTKTFLAIVASMVNRCRIVTQRITDYNVGSVARTLLEAPAQEIDELYQQMLWGLQEAIQVSVYNSFNFPALTATPASNLIRVTTAVQSASILIPATTSFQRSDGSMIYKATTDVLIPVGASFVDVPVAASVAGTAGNMPALGTFSVGITIPGLIGATNLSAFDNGTDGETASARKVRFNAYIQTLSRGTIASLLYALTRLTVLLDSSGNIIERVATANIDEPYLTDPVQPPGLVNAFIHNGVGGTSVALVQQAAAVLNGYVQADGTKVAGYKAAGVVVQTFAAGEQLVPITGMLTVGPTFDANAVVAQVTAALYTYVQQIAVGKPYLSSIASGIVTQIAGVWDFEPVSPVNYVLPSFNVKLMPGTILVIGWLQASTVVSTQTSGILA